MEISCLGFKELTITVEKIRANNYKVDLETTVTQRSYYQQ